MLWAELTSAGESAVPPSLLMHGRHLVAQLWTSSFTRCRPRHLLSGRVLGRGLAHDVKPSSNPLNSSAIVG